MLLLHSVLSPPIVVSPSQKKRLKVDNFKLYNFFLAFCIKKAIEPHISNIAPFIVSLAAVVGFGLNDLVQLVENEFRENFITWVFIPVNERIAAYSHLFYVIEIF